MSHILRSQRDPRNVAGVSRFLVQCNIISAAHIRYTTVEPLKLRRTKARFILGSTVNVTSYEGGNDSNLLQGLPSSLEDIKPVTPIESVDQEGPYTQIIVPDYFPPGSVMVFETQLQGIEADLDAFCSSGAEEAFADLDFVDLNIVLHRAEGEELDATDSQIGVYNVPDMGKLTYFLGMEFTCIKHGIILHQHNYIKGILKRFRLQDCNKAATPTETNLKLLLKQEVKKQQMQHYTNR